MPHLEKPSRYDGVFYPGNRSELETMLGDFELGFEDLGWDFTGQVVGIVSPHAGYVYSGRIAARSFYAARDRNPQTVVILGLAHRVRIEGVSILRSEACSTPLGRIECDVEFAQALEERLPFARYQGEAHLSEHSVETQLPFVRRYFPTARIVEILTQDLTAPIPETLGEAIAAVAKEQNKAILVVASTDLSHYPTAEAARTLDQASLETLTEVDPGKVRETLREAEARIHPNISCAVCSKAAVLAGMEASLRLGATRGEVLGYANSGDTKFGDPSRVVGYGSLAWVNPQNE